MNHESVLLLSKCLIVTFVTTVTLWYFVTPYIVQPHPSVINDLLTKAQVREQPAAKIRSSKPVTSSGAAHPVTSSHPVVRIENWTKWRLYVRNSNQVIHGGTSDLISMNNSKAVMYMEWRQDYEISVVKDDTSSSASSGGLSKVLEASLNAPLFSFQRWGIYNHLATEVSADGYSVRIVPRFLFGIPIRTVTKMYSPSTTSPSEDSLKDVPDDQDTIMKILAKLPVIGVFSASTRYDRVIIQAYMNLVTLSVILLLWANNPPESLLKPSTSPNANATANKTTSGNDGNESSDAGASPKNGRRNSARKSLSTQ